MEKFYVGAKMGIEVSMELVGEDSADVESRMYEVLARIERELGVGITVQLGDQTVHNVRFDSIESEVEHVEELDEEIEKSHAATNSVTKIAM